MLSSTLLYIKLLRISMFAHTEILYTWVCWGVVPFMIFKLFHSSSWLFLPQILMWYFETISSARTYSNKSAHKTNSFFKHEVSFKFRIGSKKLKSSEDACPGFDAPLFSDIPRSKSWVPWILIFGMQIKKKEMETNVFGLAWLGHLN